MKLKEKLAEEYLLKSNTWNPGMDGYFLGEYSEIYLAGFEKAREMAVLEAQNYPTKDEDGEPSKPYGFCNTCGGGPSVAKFIKRLGEEEV